MAYVLFKDKKSAEECMKRVDGKAWVPDNPTSKVLCCKMSNKILNNELLKETKTYDNKPHLRNIIYHNNKDSNQRDNRPRQANSPQNTNNSDGKQPNTSNSPQNNKNNVENASSPSSPKITKQQDNTNTSSPNTNTES
eukprot:UN34426